MGMPDVQELQEARPQLPVPQDSLDVQEAVNSSWPDSARQSAILASKHLSSRCDAALLFFLGFQMVFQHTPKNTKA